MAEEDQERNQETVSANKPSQVRRDGMWWLFRLAEWMAVPHYWLCRRALKRSLSRTEIPE